MVKHQLYLLISPVENDREVVLLRIRNQDVADFRSDPVERILNLLLEVVLIVFLVTLQLLLLVADRPGAALAFLITECCGLGLQLLL